MKLSEIKTVSEFMEMLDWVLDENGLVITDYDLLLNTVLNTFSDLEQDVDLPDTDDPVEEDVGLDI
jgi:hypothetical protein